MERLVLSKEIYDNRKKEYMERIEAMINYATNDDICRSRQLLRYFGEERSTDCNQCDVCIAHKSTAKTKTNRKEPRNLLQNSSATKTTLHHRDKSINFNRDAIEYAVEYMLNEEKYISQTEW